MFFCQVLISLSITIAFSQALIIIVCSETKCQSFDHSIVFSDRAPHFVISAQSDSNWPRVEEAIKSLSTCGVQSQVVHSDEKTQDCENDDDGKPLVLGFQNSDWSSINPCPNSMYVDVQNISCDANRHAIRIQTKSPVDFLFHEYPFRGDILKNRTLCVATVPYNASSFARVKTDSNGTEEYEGVVIQILDRLSESLGFRYTLINPPDGEYGVMQANNSFTGMAGMLERRECDIVAADFSVTYSRSQVLDYSPVPFHYDSIGILINMSNRQRRKLKLWEWASPFDLSLWICFLVLLPVVGGLLYCGHRFGTTDIWAHRHFSELGNCLLYVFSAYINQGLNIHPKSWWGYTLLTFWWLLCLLEIASYSSFLISTLTAPPPIALPFSSLEELVALLDSGEYKACVQAGTRFVEEIQIQNTESDPLRRLGRWFATNPDYLKPDSDSCIKLMLDSTTNLNVAYLSEVTELESFQRMHCQNYSLVILPPRFCITMYSLAFQKGSPYTSLISPKLLELVSNGLASNWYQNYSTIDQSCDISDPHEMSIVRASHVQLSIFDIGGVFVLFIIGVCLCVIIFFGELIVYKKMLN